ncbi:hypothetical protein RRG08_028032 [Elysia crispata]|uniref:Uncharacterized protein n=1 Tax=Elysia crispata TaxID=231223 RepID=A0AAE1BD83_9GAST|nr:hypothetical protein RRG08_028032 [Elysia crispata]
MPLSIELAHPPCLMSIHCSAAVISPSFLFISYVTASYQTSIDNLPRKISKQDYVVEDMKLQEGCRATVRGKSQVLFGRITMRDLDGVKENAERIVE